jgi:uncharacterized protein (TIGR03435 family)
MRLDATVLLLSVSVVSAYAQTEASVVAPAFEVASVKSSPPPGPGWRSVGCKGGPGTADPGLFTCTNANIHLLVTSAFKLQAYEYEFAGRDDTDYEISAKVPPGTTSEQFDRTLQNLLTERFNLAYHREKKQMSVYNLVIGRGGIKMKESRPDIPASTGGDTLDAAEAPAVRQPPLDADGFPAVPPPRPGQISLSMLGGRARWATIGTTM